MIGATAGQTTGGGMTPPRVTISHVALTAPAAGTTSAEQDVPCARRIGD
jgi:hypothetical protein